ncbi:MAG: radical SAM/Cys-rich domain protein [Cyanobacteria bacterium K_Offshore_surface_m2_239]|nr:radical SAM/Cys-rich domain protein [Cyanobacteria bacterium K_Offshore_surface_m2_239]
MVTVSPPTVSPSTAFPPLTRGELHTLQVNLGYRCNQACRHCHVDAGPWREERMDSDTLALIPAVLQALRLRTLDLTGGAPELHPQFRELVREARRLNVEVIDRCNLTILLEPDQQDLASFLAAQKVTVVASLPCVEAETVDRQRGAGVFSRSLEALRRLNSLGYGRDRSGLALHLVYNPLGPTLPPAQKRLEAFYRDTLLREHGVVFNTLKVLTNMPIQRFADQLRREGTLDRYRDLLRDSHSPENLNHVMCRGLISVDWQGRLYDCDFNQMLAMPAAAGRHLRDLLEGLPLGSAIAVADHCFGCTAGHGSSCGGALRTDEEDG